jgi:RNA polymerase sigma factor (sigma-70 family)
MPADHSADDSARDRDQFMTTRWSVVLAAGRAESDDPQRALTSLCEQYWFPLYAYVRRQVPSPHDAQDLTQAFFAELLEKDFVQSADPQRGRFRAFLLTAMRNFLAKQWRKAKAQRRGGGRAAISLDFDSAAARYALELRSTLTPEAEFDRQWAVTLLNRVLQQLADECAAAGKERLFERTKGFLVGDPDQTTYAAVAPELNMTEAAVKMAVHRLRSRYRELLRREIAGTVADPQDVDDEIRQLFAALQA